MPILVLDPHLPPIPEDHVRVDIEVDRQRCGTIRPDVDQRLTDFEQHGLNVPISRLIAYSGIHSMGAVTDFWGRGIDVAQIHTTWSELAHCNPGAVPHRRTRKRKLVVDPGPNPRIAAFRSEMLGVGMALYIATRLYELPYRFWHPTGLARWDLEGPARNGGRVKIEARARLNRSGWKRAIQEVHAKFPPGGDFATAAGIIFAPRTTANTRNADVMIVDPEGTERGTGHRDDLRALLLHYAPFFEVQGIRRVSYRLRQLSSASRREFDQYLRSGDAELKSVRFHRTFFRTDAGIFLGTAWQGTGWPPWLAHATDFRPATGVFYWGLWEAVIQALREGRLEDVSTMGVRETLSRLRSNVFILLSDATALAWAPSEGQLYPSMLQT